MDESDFDSMDRDNLDRMFDVESEKEPEVTNLKTGKTWETFESYMREMVDNGYLTNEGAPLKCQSCNSEKLKIGKEFHGPVCVEEYEMVCENCGVVVGEWSYGHWQL